MTKRWGFIVALAIGAAVPDVARAAETAALVAVSNNVGAVNGGSDGTGTAITVDFDSGAGEHFTHHSRPGFSLAYDQTSGTLYGMQGLGGGRQQLVTLNKTTLEIESVVGVVTDGTSFYRVAAAAFTDSGQLYGIGAVKQRVGGVNVPVGVLVEIDPTDASATVVGSLGMAVYSRGGTVADGTFYLGTNTSNTSRELWIYDVDLSTGAASLVGDTGVLGDAIGMATGSDDELLAVMTTTTSSQSSLYEIDASTGAASLIGATGYHYLSGFSYFDRTVECGLAAVGDIDISGKGTIDLYDCGSGSTSGDAEICANGSIALSDDAVLDGDLFYSGSVSVDGDATVTGTTEELTADVESSTVDTSAAQKNNDNSSIGEDSEGDEPYDPSSGLFYLQNDASITLSSGTYYFTDMKVSGKGTLYIDGTVEIYVEGTVDFGDDSSVNPGCDGSLSLFVAGSEVKLTGDGEVCVEVVAPDAYVELGNGAVVYGVIEGDQIKIQDDAQLHIAECML